MNSNARQTEQSMKHNGNRVTVKDFIILAKPGIIISNSLAALGGFWIAWLQSERTGGGPGIFAAMAVAMIGTALVMASSTVFNNFLTAAWTQRWREPAPAPASRENTAAGHDPVRHMSRRMRIHHACFA